MKRAAADIFLNKFEVDGNRTQQHKKFRGDGVVGRSIGVGV